LVNSGWTACLTQPIGAGPGDLAGIALTVAPDQSNVQPTTQAALVKLADDAATYYLVAGGQRFPIDAGELSVIMLGLGLEPRTPQTVPATWLNLFAAGSQLEPWKVPGAGQDPPTPIILQGQKVKVGRLLEVSSTGGKATAYAITAEGTLAQLPPLARAMYVASQTPEAQDPLKVASSEVGNLTIDPGKIYPADWPDQIGPMTPKGALPCAESTGHTDRATATLLGLPKEPAAPGVNVEATTGALVVTATVPTNDDQNAAPGYRYLIDHNGVAFPITDAAPETLARLGYTAELVGQVPQEWIALFQPGPGLSPTAAGVPPSAQTTAEANSP
jgi:hypothetical protein